ncbi:MAG TPA: 5'/3'-nucleotidase SurE [Rugosimonospora sp.]
MRALITNDDGIDAQGVRHLAIAARDAGLDVVVAAPLSEASGNGASIAVVERDGQVPVTRRELDGLRGVPAFAVDAPPAFIVLIATRDAFGPPPDVVLSGVNRGANTGRSVLHSGTVGAALTAVAHGIPALAVSLDLVGGFREAAPEPGDSRAHWETAARLAALLLPVRSDQFALNLNVPNLPYEQVRGLREARLASFGSVQTRVTEESLGVVEAAVGEAGEVPEPDTDSALVAAGFATVTALTPPREADVPRLALPPYGG